MKSSNAKEVSIDLYKLIVKAMYRTGREEQKTYVYSSFSQANTNLQRWADAQKLAEREMQQADQFSIRYVDRMANLYVAQIEYLPLNVDIDEFFTHGLPF